MKPVAKLNYFLSHSRLIWKNWRILPSVAAGYFRALVLRRPVLRTVEFAITPFCNVNCTMCYATRIADRTREMLSPREYADIWRQAKAQGAFSVHLSGGEPTIRKDLFEVISAFDPGRTLISMTTNATRLSDEFLAKLRAAGVSALHFSLNSDDPRENDVQRDFEGHHALVLDRIRSARKLGFEVCLSIVVSHEGLDGMRRLTELARREGCGVVFSLATPSGNWAGGREHLLTEEEWQEVDRYMEANKHVRSDWTINLSMRKECPAGYEKISVSPYGDVQGCAMDFIAHGNLRDEKLALVLQRMRQWEPYRSRSPRCLIGADRRYIDAYILPLAGEPVLPIPIDRHPALTKGGEP